MTYRLLAVPVLALALAGCSLPPAHPLPTGAASSMSSEVTVDPGPGPVVTEIPVTPTSPDVVPAPEPAPKVTTCDVVREALLTGTHAQKVRAMKALKTDRTATATVREAASTWLEYDKPGEMNKSLQSIAESSIQLQCELS